MRIYRIYQNLLALPAKRRQALPSGLIQNWMHFLDQFRCLLSPRSTPSQSCQQKQLQDLGSRQISILLQRLSRKIKLTFKEHSCMGRSKLTRTSQRHSRRRGLLLKRLSQRPNHRPKLYLTAHWHKHALSRKAQQAMTIQDLAAHPMKPT